MNRLFKVVVLSYFEEDCKLYKIELREFSSNRMYKVVKKVDDFDNVGDVLYRLYELNSEWFDEYKIDLMSDKWCVKVDID